MKHESSIGSLCHWVPMLIISFGVVLGFRFFRPDIFGIVYVIKAYSLSCFTFLAFYFFVPVCMTYILVILAGKVIRYAIGVLASDPEG